MQTPPSLTIRLHPNDDVVIARRQLIGGTSVPEERLMVSGLIPAGHKIATRDIALGERVHRYSQPIGVASRAIKMGQHIHTHNLVMAELEHDYAFCTDIRETHFSQNTSMFLGIERAGGRIATRNFIGVITSVNCSATVAHAIADHFRRDVHPAALEPYVNVDGVVALTHSGGCGIDSQGEGLAILRRTLAGYAQHPNFSAVILVGLGCETNQLGELMRAHALSDGLGLRSYTIQDRGGTRQSVLHGIELINEILPQANRVTRSPVSAANLVVGLQCGGSDGYSGITANPALGAAVDLLVQEGGTAILSETPEIFGAEHLLTRRAVTPEIGEKLLRRFRWWDDYCSRNGATLSNNPSAGNKAGGLTTLVEKSLGGVAKGGTTNLVDVYEYAEPVTAKGLVFMDTPGYDPVSATGQVAGGANLICFTTGRGSAYGCQPCPSLKLATNTALWERQQDDMDINCGTIAEGTDTIQELGRQIYDLMLQCASGQRSRSEIHGYGQQEFVPWQISVVT